MTEQEKAAIVIETLDRLFPQPLIPLEHKDPYTLLISALLSAQTTDAMVNRVTPILFEKADTPQKMARLNVDEILKIIKPCGLAPQKAKNIHRLSQMLVDQHGGQVPASFEELETLPGVGHKTASVVMAQAFGIAAFPVDTHIHRLAYRWGLSNGKSVQQTEKDLKRIFPEDQWIKLHLQIIYFGREYCPARNHDPKACPLCSKIGRKEP
ncbi:endonuclease III [candidate division KSB1 bacterium]|nr:endonuclease III [candidate division KSB1 bacterium]NIR68677.1 endonuclease III [candidate division KSB1 bacterium]NIS27166.1 endonuclease III [candidate division KSB1 bacterium]NIT74052.1 endonuclease III [candidate division KSB1 bacterium]NIU27918.1 endonuclease III [candidate division KSB1 bacterium]